MAIIFCKLELVCLAGDSKGKSRLAFCSLVSSRPVEQDLRQGLASWDLTCCALRIKKQSKEGPNSSRAQSFRGIARRGMQIHQEGQVLYSPTTLNDAVHATQALANRRLPELQQCTAERMQSLLDYRLDLSYRLDMEATVTDGR